MSCGENEENLEESRTLLSHFSARTRLVALGISMWGLGFLVAAAPGATGATVSLGSGVLLALVLIVSVAVASTLSGSILVNSTPHGETRTRIRPRAALPILLVLCAVLFFFGTTNRHEVFTGKPESMRLAADWLLAGGSLVGILSIALGLGSVEVRTWTRTAAASMLMIAVGLLANAALYRHVASFYLGAADFWGQPYIWVCEELGFLFWAALCLGILAWDSTIASSVGIAARRRILLAAAAGFAIATLLALLVAFLGVLEVSPLWDAAEDVLQPSYWPMAFGRLAWYYLLLFIAPILILGIRATLRGMAAAGDWLASVLPFFPVLLLLGLLGQIWVVAYANWMSRPWWPIWIPALLLIPIMALWLRVGEFRSSRARSTILLAAAASLVAAGLWMWFRGPSLPYGWSLHRGVAWRLVLRRVVPLTLISAGLCTIPTLRGTRGTPKREGVGTRPSGPWPRPWLGLRSLLLCPSLICGSLFLGILLELVHRIWLRYGTVLPHWSSFPPTMMFTTAIALAGSILAWRVLFTIPGMGQPSTSLRRSLSLRYAGAVALAIAIIATSLVLYYDRQMDEGGLELSLGVQIPESGPQAVVRCVNNGRVALQVAGFALGKSPQIDLRGPHDDWYRLVDPWSPSPDEGEDPKKGGLGPGASLDGEYDLLGLWRRLNDSELIWGRRIFRGGDEYTLVATYRPYPGDADAEKAQTTLIGEFRFNTDGWPVEEVPFPIYITRQDQTRLPGNQGMDMIAQVEDLDVAAMIGENHISGDFERVGIFPEPCYIDGRVLSYFTNRSIWFKANAPDHPDFTESGWLRYTATIRRFNGTVEMKGSNLTVRATEGLQLTGWPGTYWYDAQGATEIRGGFIIAMQLSYMESFGNLGGKGIIVETQYAFFDDDRRLVALITPQTMGIVMV